MTCESFGKLVESALYRINNDGNKVDIVKKAMAERIEFGWIRQLEGLKLYLNKNKLQIRWGFKNICDISVLRVIFLYLSL